MIFQNKNKTSNGFTLVELIIVIAVIGILATLAVVGLTGVQEDGRDKQRSSAVVTLSEALEKYYDTHGEYPGCSTMIGSPAAVKAALGVDLKVLKAPSNSAANSIVCSDLTSSAGDDVYAYIGDTSATCTSGTACTQYTLKYIEESTDEIKSLTSRRLALSPLTTGTSVLSLASAAAASVNLTWTAASNATSYTVESSTNNTFPTSLTTQANYTGTSGTYTGLLPVTTYYFRIKATAANGTTGGWSNTVTTTTAVIGAPTIASSSSPVGEGATLYITAVDGANAYVVQRARDTAFTSNLATLPTSTSTTVVDDPQWGFNYYYRAKAINTLNGQESGYGPTKSVGVPRP